MRKCFNLVYNKATLSLSTHVCIALLVPLSNTKKIPRQLFLSDTAQNHVARLFNMTIVTQHDIITKFYKRICTSRRKKFFFYIFRGKDKRYLELKNRSFIFFWRNTVDNSIFNCFPELEPSISFSNSVLLLSILICLSKSRDPSISFIAFFFLCFLTFHSSFPFSVLSFCVSTIFEAINEKKNKEKSVFPIRFFFPFFFPFHPHHLVTAKTLFLSSFKNP